MNQLDRASLRALQGDINQALKSVAVKHGVALQMSGGSFTSTGATLKLVVALGESGASAIDLKAANEYKNHAHLFGLDPAWLGCKFTYGGNLYQITGLAPSRHKYPVMVTKNETAKRVVQADMVRAAMEQQQQPAKRGRK